MHDINVSIKKTSALSQMIEDTHCLFVFGEL